VIGFLKDRLYLSVKWQTLETADWCALQNIFFQILSSVIYSSDFWIFLVEPKSCREPLVFLFKTESIKVYLILLLFTCLIFCVVLCSVWQCNRYLGIKLCTLLHWVAHKLFNPNGQIVVPWQKHILKVCLLSYVGKFQADQWTWQ
jgi:hypothetical protein